VKSPGRHSESDSRGVVARVACARIDCHRLDNHWVDWPVTSSSPHLSDLVDDVPAGLVGHLTEDRVPPVEMGLRTDGNEELRTVSARTCVGHGQQVRLIEGKIGMEFVAKLVARTACARPQRAAALNHEAIDYAMEGQPVVKLASRPHACPGVGVLLSACSEPHEVVYRLGSLITKEHHVDVAMVGMQGCSLLCHFEAPFCRDHPLAAFNRALRRTQDAGPAAILSDRTRWRYGGKCSTGEHEVSHNGGNVSRSSRRAEAARKQVAPASEDFVHSAADRVGPMVHSAADRVGPLAQTAATRVGPLAEAAADRIGAAADKVSPLAHSAADRLGPLAQSAAERVGPITHDAADRLAPLAHSAADRIAPLTYQAVERVSPYAQQAVGRVSPYAQQAAERIVPIASSAKQRGARVAHDAVDRIAPVVDEALEKVSPAVEAARSRMSEEIVPKLSQALSAAAGAPVVAETTKRGKAVLAAAKGELELPKQKKKRRWLVRLAIVAAVAGAAVFAVRKFLGGKDADWQAARPTTPYSPPAQTSASPTVGTTAGAPVVDAMDDDNAHEDPQGGASAHMLNLEADGASVPDQPAEGGDYDAPADVTTNVDDAPADMTTNVDEAPADMTTRVDEAFAEAADRIGVEAPTDSTLASEDVETPTSDAGLAEPTPGSDQDGAVLSEPAVTPGAGGPRYQGEGVYVGSEPPEGFTIKGNERSMKYHVPESAGYSRTVAEVWFNSEDAAQQAGFVRAQR
jgi:negative regulator of sigma E activity